MRINKEGYKIILVTFLVTATMAVLFMLFTPIWLGIAVTALSAGALIFTMVFFREPTRPRISDPDIIYAPADGRIVIAGPVNEKEYFNEDRPQISVFMSLTNVHINWYPVGGTIAYYKYHPGRYLVAWHPKSSEKNEHTTVVVDSAGVKILFRQIAGLIARRIVCYAKEGLNVNQNEKCGFIKFGSRVDVVLPKDAELLVSIGDRVIGSQTPIARIKK